MNRQNDYRFMKTCHLNLIAKEPGPNKLVCVDPDCIDFAEKNGFTKETLPRHGDMCHRKYGSRCVNCIIDTAIKHGYLVAYNHPSWSQETITDIAPRHGMYAIEVYNHGAATCEGFPGDDMAVYDQLWERGQRVFCIANDDNHNARPLTSPMCDSFGGFTMIKARELSYASVIEALESGHFYASQGPKIFDLYVEDGCVHMTCSPVVRIQLVTAGRSTVKGHMRQYAALPEAPLESIRIELLPNDRYFRIQLSDSCGKRAWTHAYDLSDLDKRAWAQEG